MAEQNEQDQNDQIISFEGAEYKYSELSEQGKVVVNQLNVISQDIMETSMLLSRHEAARTTFIAAFKEVIEDTINAS
jgi:hypothetical protein